ncbi:MAG: radical SAM protein, partial [Bacteroidales bacterium]|nr:radical SAM protein [Bacteroidales bacterium]
MNAEPALLGLSPAEIAGLLTDAPFPAYRAKQVAQWIYGKRADSFDAMSNLGRADRDWLTQRFRLGNLPPAEERVSTDGTRKYLFNVSEADEKPAYVECVYIPDGDRATLCVSSQSGCRMNCGFCATGSQGFNRSLTATQILNQFYSLPFADEISSFVFMGMGEPFDNTDAVLRALNRLTAADGFAFSPRRITVSTVGVIPGMKRFLDESECHLAVSLH